ncbi:hypothetical protein ACHAXT_003739 [Thalassiosira profunda]
MSHRRRQLLVAAVLCSIDASLQNAHVMGGSASAAPRGRLGRLMGRRRIQVGNVDDGGLKLGQLEEMMQNDDGGGSNESDVLGPSALMGADGKDSAWSQRPSPERTGEAAQSNANATQLRRGLGRIHLDLSGRIMCHLVSPNADSGRDVDCDGETVPLFALPSKQQPALAGRFDARAIQQLPVASGLQRYVPNLYLGANYDLDEVWFGATRWIARCSWGPLALAGQASERESKASNALQLAQQLQRRISPSSPSSIRSKWTIDAEGERSVFDGRDTTTRVRLLQHLPSSSLASRETTAVQSPLQLSLEHDSAKYHEALRGTKRSIRYAPAFTASLQTPFLHPRLQLRSKRTWIVQEGGDRYGNYYGGDHFGGESGADRRLECAKTRFREGVPRSNPAPDDVASTGNAGQGFAERLSRWLENDGWMPKRVAADLAGNLVSVSEVGFFGDADGSSDERLPSRRMLPFRNAGIRLRVSKKMDWASLGIFPWSRNAVNGHGQDEGSVLLDALHSTHLQLELCGLHLSGAGRSSVGVHVDPLDWRGSLKFVVGQESAAIVQDRS